MRITINDFDKVYFYSYRKESIMKDKEIRDMVRKTINTGNSKFDDRELKQYLLRIARVGFHERNLLGNAYNDWIKNSKKVVYDKNK